MEHWLATPGQREQALRLAVSIPGTYWVTYGHVAASRRWFAAAREMTGDSALRAHALVMGAYFAFVQGDAASGVTMLSEGAEMAHRVNDPATLAWAALFQGVCAPFVDDAAAGVAILRPAIGLLQHIPVEEDLDIHLFLLSVAVLCSAYAREPELGLQCRQPVLDLTAAYPGSFHRGWALWTCALFDWSIGEYERAEAEINESLLIKLRWLPGDEFGLALVIEAMAAIVVAQGDHQRTATLLGFADALWHTLDADRAAHFDTERIHIACVREARTHLGHDRFEHEYAGGRAMAPEQLPALVSGRLQTQPTKSELTVRETEVARLVAEGLTNRQIAERLVLSPRTVEGHVEKVLGKLGVHRRGDVANWLARQPRAG